MILDTLTSEVWRSQSVKFYTKSETGFVMRSIFSVILALISPLLSAEISITDEPIPESVMSEIDAQVLGSYSFDDKKGSHVLVLTSKETKTEDTDRWSLHALQFLETNTGWKKEWVIRDWVDCPDLDIDARFLFDFFTFTDLDDDGIAETTVSYSLMCAGGIAPSTIKTIMREGKDKYAVRGESFVYVKAPPGKNDIVDGGTFKADWTLDLHPDFKHHLISVWKRAAGVTPTE